MSSDGDADAISAGAEGVLRLAIGKWSTWDSSSSPRPAVRRRRRTSAMAQPSLGPVDAPTHHGGRGPRPRNRASDRDRLTARRILDDALTVISIPYFEWGEQRTRNDKKAYSRQRAPSPRRV